MGDQGPIVPTSAAEEPINPGTRIGHVHLRTSDIDRIRDFYVGVLGFDVIAEARDVPGWGTTGDILFVSAGGYHHHLGFNTWLSKDGGPTPDGVAGLHHVAIAYPTRRALADAYRRLRRVDVADPAGGVLLHARRDLHPRSRRQHARAHVGQARVGLGADPEGHQAMVFGDPLDLDGLLRELDGGLSARLRRRPVERRPARHSIRTGTRAARASPATRRRPGAPAAGPCGW